MKFVVAHIFVFSFVLVFGQVNSVQDGPWSDPNTWSSGVPGNNSDVVINHQVNIDQNDRCRSMTISSSGTLINDGFTLRIDRAWTNNGSFIDTLGTINFENTFFGWLFGGTRTITGATNFNNVSFRLHSMNINSAVTIRGVLSLDILGILTVNTGSLTFIASEDYHGRIGNVNGGALNGTFTSERYVGRCNGWSWYAGPFDASLAQFAASSGGRMVYTGFPGSDAPTFNYVNTYFYDENWSSVGFTGYVVPSNVSDIVSRGTGFWYWNSDTVFNSGQTMIPQMWKMSLTGSMNVGATFNFSLNYTNTGNSANDGWNFLGNPYPGTLDWDAGGAWSSSGLDGALYTYNTCSQAYASYAGGVGTNGGTNLIPSYQGFHVKAISGSPTLSTSGAALITTDADLKAMNLSQNILRIHLGDDEIVLRANENSNDQFNIGIDALKFAGDYERVYSQNFSGDERYSINTFNDSNAHIPLYTRGSGVLMFDEVESWESHYDLTLEDLSTGFMYDIHPGFGIQYSNSDTVNFENRFIVHLFGGSELGLEDNQEDFGIHVRYDQDELVVFSEKTIGTVEVQLINMMGQIVYATQNVLNPGGFRLKRPNQVMMLRVIGDNINKSIKVF